MRTSQRQDTMQVPIKGILRGIAPMSKARLIENHLLDAMELRLIKRKRKIVVATDR